VRRRAASRHGALQRLQFGEHARAFDQIGLALGREAEPPRGPLQQTHAEAPLERGQALADRGGRHAELLRGGGEAAVLVDGGEEGEIGKAVHEGSGAGKVQAMVQVSAASIHEW